MAEQNTPFELREGRVYIFKNKKRTDVKQPEYWGKAMIDGVEKRLSLWVEKKDGKPPYFSGEIQTFVPKEEAAPAPAPSDSNSDDDLPF